MIHPRHKGKLRRSLFQKEGKRPGRATSFLQQVDVLGVWEQESQLRERQKKICAQTLGMARGLVWQQVWKQGTDTENKKRNWGWGWDRDYS